MNRVLGKIFGGGREKVRWGLGKRVYWLAARFVLLTKYFSCGKVEQESNVYWTVHHCNKNERPTWCHLLFYFTSYVLNMFLTLIYPSSGACDCVVELPHRSSSSQFVVCWRFGAAGFGWCSFCRLKHNFHMTRSLASELLIWKHLGSQNVHTALWKLHSILGPEDDQLIGRNM